MNHLLGEVRAFQRINKELGSKRPVAVLDGWTALMLEKELRELKEESITLCEYWNKR